MGPICGVHLDCIFIKRFVENKFVTKLIYTKMMYIILIKLFVKILILTRNIFDTHLNQFYKNGHTIMEFKKKSPSCYRYDIFNFHKLNISWNRVYKKLALRPSM